MISTRKSDPSLKDLLDLAKRDALISINCHKVATIQSFDPSKSTCTATINYKRSVMSKQPGGDTVQVAVDYPLVVECPVIFLGNKEMGVNVPVTKGDQCLLLFNDQDLSNWFIGRTNNIPPSARLHAFADAVAIVGLRFKNDGGFYDQDRVSIFNGETVVGVSAELVRIKNEQHTLKGLLNDLITNVKNLVTQTAAITVTGVQGGPGASGPPANIVQIQQISMELDQTATKIGELLE